MFLALDMKNETKYTDEFIKSDITSIFLEHGIEIIHFENPYHFTMLIDKETSDIYIFKGNRSFNQAFSFYYNGNLENYKEGINYFVIKKSYSKPNPKRSSLRYIKEDQYYTFESFFKYGIRKSLTKKELLELDLFFFYASKCATGILNKKVGITLESQSYPSLVVYDSIDGVEKYTYELLDNIEITNVTESYPVYPKLKKYLKRENYNPADAHIGLIVFDEIVESFLEKKPQTIERGAMLYYQLGDESVFFKYFMYQGEKSVLKAVEELISKCELSAQIYCDNNFLYDLLFKTFENYVDLILDISNPNNFYLSYSLKHLSELSLDKALFSGHLDILAEVVTYSYDHIANSNTFELERAFRKETEYLEGQINPEDDIEYLEDEEFNEEDEFNFEIDSDSNLIS